MDLSAAPIVITGAARGLGLEMARTLAAAGARVGLIDLDRDALAEAHASLPGDGHAFAAASVADEDAVIAAFDLLEGALGGIRGLVNNAGITRDGLLVKARDGKVEGRMSIEQWRSVIDVDLTGVFLCGREAATRMIGAGSGGVIVNIASISRHGNFGQSNYAAAKAGVAAMTVTWAKELARHGIRAASISPGFVGTEMVRQMPEKAIERITAQIPLGRLGLPEEIAATVRFIFDNDFVTGRDFAIDGGLRL
jgi:3-oxoacyl-[acyl-carrier protein] reductase